MSFLWNLLTPRVGLVKAYVARRDSELWAPLFSSPESKRSSDDKVALSEKSHTHVLVNGSADSNAAVAKLPAVELRLQNGDLDILASDIAGIVDGIKQGRWNSEQVTAAFIRSARRAQLATNCLTEVMFESALARARELDAHFERTGKLVGPLHGVPFSIKDHYLVQGTRTTIGFTSWIKDQPIADRNAALVDVYIAAGAIPLCKTNVPQTMMSFETKNPVWGRTTNPHRINSTCGGSSGGEAALLASDGAAFGLGSDIGGSLRIPTGYCGIYALKPSAHRFPKAGNVKFVEGQEGIISVLGPMGRSVADIQLLTKVVIERLHPGPDASFRAVDSQREINCEVMPIQPLREKEFDPIALARERGRPLRLGYYTFDDFNKSSPAVCRAMDETIAALQSKYSSSDVELIRVDPTLLRSKEAMRIFMAITSADGFDGLVSPLKGDWMERALWLTIPMGRWSKLFRSTVYYLLRYIIRDNHLASVSATSGRKSAKAYWEVLSQRSEFGDYFEKRIWRGLDLDAILCPVQATPALQHGGCTTLSPLAVSTILYNVMDNSVSIVPVTRVDPALDSAEEPLAKDNATALAKWEKWNHNNGLESSKMVSHGLYGAKVYDANKMVGLPVSIQTVARPHEDELAIGVAALVDRALGPRGFGPGDFTKKRASSQ